MALVPTRGPLMSMLSDLESVDPDGAHELVRLALYEQLADDVEKFGPRLREGVAKRYTQTSAEARRVLVRDFVAKRERGEDVSDILRAGEYLGATEEVINKAIWDRREHPRGPNGRFVHTLSGIDNALMRQREAGTAIRRMQSSGFLQSADAAPTVRVHGHPLDEKGVANRSRRTYADVQAGRDLDENIEESGLHPTHLEIHPNQTNAPSPGTRRGMAFDVTSRLAGERKGLQVATAAPLDNGELGSALDRVMRESKGTDRQAYRRMDATGRALQSLSAPGSGAHAVGAVARLTGQLGPEAENVLGRPIARTAYRYRGTEKKPDQALVEAVDDVSTTADRTAAAAANGQSRAQLHTEEYANAGYQGIAHAVAGYYAGTHTNVSGAGRRGEGRAPGAVGGGAIGARERRIDPGSDQLDLRLRGDSAVGYFMRKLISPEQYGLSIAAGRVPPSQGVIINADGSVVSEAVGFGEDHYLPFDLKNLKSLNGGQYVRTRAAGGPSTEDIYTGLLTGARQIQVVSNSGVFTVEFDPDLRGGRRYSDKARQMVDRYSALLKTVEGGEQVETPLPEARRRELMQQAYESTNFHDREAQQEYTRLEHQEIARARFSGASMDEFKEAARNQVTTELGQSHGVTREGVEDMVNERAQQLADKQENETARYLRLDGVGYARALKSLQAEFPYFIRSVDYETTREFASSRRLGGSGAPRPAEGGGKRTPDRGYVGPGQISRDNGYGRPSNRIRPGRTTTAEPEAEPKAESNRAAARPGTTRAAGTAGGDGALERINFTPREGDALSSVAAQRPDLERETVQAFEGRAPDMFFSGLFGNPPMADATWENTHNGVQALRVLFGDPAEATRQLQEFTKEGRDADRDKMIRGLTEARETLTTIAEDEDEEPTRAREAQRLLNGLPEGWFDKTIAGLQALNFAGEPWAEKASNPALHAGAKPQKFDKIDALGTDPEQYQAFLQAANQSGAKDFVQGVQELGDDPEQWASKVRQEVDNYRATVDWGSAPYPGPNARPPRGKGLTRNWAEANEIAEKGEQSPAYQRVLGLQQAWSFRHGQQMAAALSGGEAAAPKAPTGPIDLWGDPVPTSKRAPQVVVHPPGSPVAKAYAQSLRKRAGVSRLTRTSRATS